MWASKCERLHKLDPSLVQSILGALASNGMNQISLLCKEKDDDALQSHERIACAIMSCLVDWTIVVPVAAMEQSRALPSILHLIHSGLHCPLRKPSSSKPSSNRRHSFDSSMSRQPDKLHGQAIRVSPMNHSHHPYPDLIELLLQESCQITIAHLQNRLCNFPLTQGIDRVSSLVTEHNDPVRDCCQEAKAKFYGLSLSSPKASATDVVGDESGGGAVAKSDSDNAVSNEGPDKSPTLPDSPCVHLVLGTSRIVSVMERLECDHGDDGKAEPKLRPVSRLLIRDMTGKYCWDFSSVGDTVLTGQAGCRSAEDMAVSTSLNSDEASSEPRAPSPEDKLLADLLNDMADLPLEENEPSARIDYEEMEKSIGVLEQQLDESRLSSLRVHDNGNCESGEGQECLRSRIVESSPRQSLTRFDGCRRLLSHLGLLRGISGNGELDVRVLNSNSRLERSLKLLDRTPSRECSKIALIFVGEGQDHQRLVLRNMAGSERFEKFVDALGWPVDVREHQGMSGQQLILSILLLFLSLIIGCLVHHFYRFPGWS